MAQAWPSALQQLLNESGFSMKFGDTVLRTDMETGPRKVRRKSTRGINNFGGSVVLNISQYSLFYTFFNTTLNGGVLPFTFNHPITQIPTDFRFTGAPAISSLGGGIFEVSFEWEELP